MKRVFAHIGFSIAVTLIVLNFCTLFFAKVILGLIVAALFATMAFKKIRQAVAVPLCLGAAAFACLIFIITMSSSVIPAQLLAGSDVKADFTIESVQTDSEGDFSYIVKTDKIYRDNTVQNIKIRIKTDRKIGYEGDIFSGILTVNKVGEEPFRSYGYFAKGIYLTSTVKNIEKIAENHHSFNYIVAQLRVNIKDLLQNSIYGDAGKLISSLITGDKSALPDYIVENFRACGVSHLMAVSGLHITLIVCSIYLILRKCKIHIIPSTLIAYSIMTVYCGIAGFSASVIRSSIMIFIVLLGNLFKQKADGLNSLGIAVFIICLNPFAVTDLSFQLSASSVLALMTVAPWISGKVKIRKKVPKYIVQSIIATFSVLVVNTPFLWFSYGSINLTSLLLNIVMIPLAEITIISALLLMLFHFIPYAAVPFAFVSGISARLMLVITGWCSDNINMFFDISGEIGGVSLAEVLVIMGFVFIMKNKKLLKPAAVISLIIFIVVNVFSTALEKGNYYISVSDNYKNNSAIIYDNSSAVIIGSVSKSDYYRYKKLINAKNLKLDMVIAVNDNTSYSDKIITLFGAEYYVLPYYANDNDTANTKAIFNSELEIDLTDEVRLNYNLCEDYYTCDCSFKTTSVRITDDKSKIDSNASITIYTGKSRIQSTNNLISATANANDGTVLITISKYNSIYMRRENRWLQ